MIIISLCHALETNKNTDHSLIFDTNGKLKKLSVSIAGPVKRGAAPKPRSDFSSNWEQQNAYLPLILFYLSFIPMLFIKMIYWQLRKAMKMSNECMVTVSYNEKSALESEKQLSEVEYLKERNANNDANEADLSNTVNDIELRIIQRKRTSSKLTQFIPASSYHGDSSRSPFDCGNEDYAYDYQSEDVHVNGYDSEDEIANQSPNDTKMRHIGRNSPTRRDEVREFEALETKEKKDALRRRHSYHGATLIRTPIQKASELLPLSSRNYLNVRLCQNKEDFREVLGKLRPSETENSDNLPPKSVPISKANLKGFLSMKSTPPKDPNVEGINPNFSRRHSWVAGAHSDAIDPSLAVDNIDLSKCDENNISSLSDLPDWVIIHGRWVKVTI
jgi:hypothetical protein